MAARESDGPRVRVAALMIRDGLVVLVRHRFGDRTYHLLPGGGVGWRETLEQALVREIREETGFEAEVGRLLFVNDTIDPAGTRHLVNLTFEARITGGSLTDAPEDDRVEAVDLVEPWRLPEVDLRPPMAEALVHAIAENGQTAAYLGSIYTEERA